MHFRATINGQHPERSLKELKDNPLPVGSTFKLQHVEISDATPIVLNDFHVVTKNGDRIFLALVTVKDDSGSTAEFKAFTNVICPIFKVNPTQYMELTMSAKQDLYDESMKMITDKKNRVIGKVSSYLGHPELHLISFEFE